MIQGENITLLDQSVADFEQGLDSVLTNSMKTPELDASFDKCDNMISSVFSGFLFSFSIVSCTSKLQLPSSITSHKLWCQARGLLKSVLLARQMSVSILLHYFLSHPAAFGFRASSTNDIILNPAYKKTDQSISNFHTRSCSLHFGYRTTYFPHKNCIIKTITSIQGFDGCFIPGSEVHEFLTKIRAILDNAVSKWVG